MLGWAVIFLIIALVAAVFWIWRYRCGIGGHRETSVLYIPCAVRDFLDFRVAGQTRSLAIAKFSKVASPAR